MTARFGGGNMGNPNMMGNQRAIMGSVGGGGGITTPTRPGAMPSAVGGLGSIFGGGNKAGGVNPRFLNQGMMEMPNMKSYNEGMKGPGWGDSPRRWGNITPTPFAGPGGPPKMGWIPNPNMPNMSPAPAGGPPQDVIDKWNQWNPQHPYQAGGQAGNPLETGQRMPGLPGGGGTVGPYKGPPPIFQTGNMGINPGGMYTGGGKSWAEQNPNQEYTSRHGLPGYSGGATTMDMVKNPFFRGQPRAAAPTFQL